MEKENLTEIKELTKEQKLSAIAYMKKEMYNDYANEDDIVLGLCTYFSYSLYFMKLKYKKSVFEKLFPELFIPIKKLQKERDSGFAWEFQDYQSRLKFLNDLEKQVRQQEPKHQNT